MSLAHCSLFVAYGARIVPANVTSYQTREAMVKSYLAALILFVLVVPAHAQVAVPTQVMVRAIAHDAKLIGSNVGGARITIQDVENGQVLAEGMQEGNTGSTELIMNEPRVRGQSPYTTEGAAGYLATVMLTRPTVVDITAYGPLATPHALMRTTKRMLLVPGKDVLGEGVLLELNGFTVELLDTTAAASAGEPLTVRAKVTLLCGCVTEPGGTWDADAIEIVAHLTRGDETVASVPLEYAGEQSTYIARLDAPDAGTYTLDVIASDPGKANFGMATRTLVVTE